MTIARGAAIVASDIFLIANRHYPDLVPFVAAQFPHRGDHFVALDTEGSVGLAFIAQGVEAHKQTLRPESVEADPGNGDGIQTFNLVRIGDLPNGTEEFGGNIGPGSPVVAPHSWHLFTSAVYGGPDESGVTITAINDAIAQLNAFDFNYLSALASPYSYKSGTDMLWYAIAVARSSHAH